MVIQIFTYVFFYEFYSFSSYIRSLINFELILYTVLTIIVWI